MVFLDGLFDALFGYALSWPPLWAIVFISFFLSLLIILLYKYLTNQKEMKRLKGELKDFQKKAKALRDHPEKMMAVQKDMMKTNMEYMRKSMKVTLVTFIPMILVLGWMDANFSYQPLLPGDDFGLGVVVGEGVEGNVTLDVPEGLEVVSKKSQIIEDSAARFTLKGEPGKYFVTVKHDDVEVDKEVIVSESEYAPVQKDYEGDVIKSVVLGNQELKVVWKLSWLWTYIIAMLVFSIGLRKLMKVY